MGLYDRDYMREKGRSSLSSKKNINNKLIIVAVISFILGIIICKFIL